MGHGKQYSAAANSQTKRFRGNLARNVCFAVFSVSTSSCLLCVRPSPSFSQRVLAPRDRQKLKTSLVAEEQSKRNVTTKYGRRAGAAEEWTDGVCSAHDAAQDNEIVLVIKCFSLHFPFVRQILIPFGSRRSLPSARSSIRFIKSCFILIRDRVFVDDFLRRRRRRCLVNLCVCCTVSRRHTCTPTSNSARDTSFREARNQRAKGGEGGVHEDERFEYQMNHFQRSF